jgi:YD repeat-containing protein
MADYYAKRNDTGPTWTDTIKDVNGNAVNLTGATVKFVMRPQSAVAPTTNAAATIVTPASGTVSYTPTAQDTATAGIYMVEWHITAAGGGLTTYPTDGYLEASIEEDIITPGGSRLVSLGEVRDYLNIQISDKSRDAKLLRVIDSTTKVVEEITGPILQRIIQNETHDGGVAEFETYFQPIASVQSVTEYRANIPYPLAQVATPDLGTIYSYMWDPFGRIMRRTVGGGITTFPPGPDSIWITYTAGYATPPSNVTHGLLELLRVNYQETQQGRPRPGFSEIDDLEPRGPVLGFYVPGRVRELLAPNRRAPSIA